MSFIVTIIMTYIAMKWFMEIMRDGNLKYLASIDLQLVSCFLYLLDLALLRVALVVYGGSLIGSNNEERPIGCSFLVLYFQKLTFCVKRDESIVNTRERFYNQTVTLWFGVR